MAKKRAKVKVKVKSKGKLRAIAKPIPKPKVIKGETDLRDRYQFPLETGTSAKHNWFVYREFHTGKFVSRKNLPMKKCRIELWRYSRNGLHKFQRLWHEERFSRRVKPIPIEKEQAMLMSFYRNNRGHVVYDKELQQWVVFTRSP